MRAGPQPTPDPWIINGNSINPNGLQIVAPAPVTGYAGFNNPPGVAPISPANGDIWPTSNGYYFRINGITVGPISGWVQPEIVTAAGDVTIGNDDIFIALHKTVAANTNFLLPSFTTKIGPVTIWDADGVFLNHTQMIIPFGSETIYGLSEYPMTEAYQNLSFYPTSLGWMIGRA